MRTALDCGLAVGMRRQLTCVTNLNLCLSYGYTCRRQTTVGFVEILKCPCRIVRMLGQGLGVPLAARAGEEVAAVDMDRAGQTRDRVGDRVDDLAPQRHRIALA